MVTKGRAAAIGIVALGIGFVGGVWIVASGSLFQLIPPPDTEPKSLHPGLPPGAVVVANTPKVKAVGVPDHKNFSGGSGGLGPIADRTDLTPAPGCSWVVEPRPFRLGGSWHKTDRERALAGESAIEPTTGGVHYFLVQSTRQGGSEIHLRPVFFDEDANRQLPQTIGSSSSKHTEGTFITNQFRLDPVRQFKPDKVAYFGIELVVPDADRLLAEAAQKEAKEKGVEILPPFTIGKPYPFDIAAADGGRLRASDFRGKAVVLVIWGPDGGGLSALATAKRAREADRKKELAVVGVSFDGSVEDARKAFAVSGADGPFALVPNDSLSRRLWRDGAQVEFVPKILLIDPEGVARFVCNSFDLQDHIDIVFGRAKRHHVPVRLGPPTKKAPGPAQGGQLKAPGPPAAPQPGA